MIRITKRCVTFNTNTRNLTSTTEWKVKPETIWIYCGSAYQVISRPQDLHCTLVRINSTSIRNWMPVAWSLNRNVKKIFIRITAISQRISMFWERTASRVVHPDIPWSHQWYDAPYLFRFLTHHDTQQQTTRRQRRKDTCECSLVGKRR